MRHICMSFSETQKVQYYIHNLVIDAINAKMVAITFPFSD